MAVMLKIESVYISLYLLHIKYMSLLPCQTASPAFSFITHHSPETYQIIAHPLVSICRFKHTLNRTKIRGKKNIYLTLTRTAIFFR